MAFVNRFSITQKGAIVITGNTLGLSKANNTDNPGINHSIGAFITTNASLPVPTGWGSIVNLANGENVTLNWQQNSSSAFLNMPPGSIVTYAELIWGGLAKDANADVSSSINNPISFITPAGTNSVTPDPTTYFDGVISSAETWYSRSQNVTALVSLAGAGKYTVGSVASALDPSNNTTNFAGWSLIVIYKNTSLAVRNMSVFAGGEIVSGTNTVDTTVSGFITPSSGSITARILVSSGEGDAVLSGDYMQFGPNTSNISELFGPNNPANPPDSLDNFFASQINIGDPNNANVGAIDTSGTFGSRNSNAFTTTNISGGRQGWDITNVNGSNSLVNGQTTATVRFATNGDIYLPNGLAIQIDTMSADISIVKTDNPNPVVPGQTITYSLLISNSGPDTAQNVVLTDAIPASISGAQFSINGGVTWNPWTSPYTVGSLTSGSSITILIRGTVNLASTGNIVNTASITSTTPDPDLSNNTSTTTTQIAPQADISVVKTGSSNPAIAGQTLTYTLLVSNAGPSTAQNVILTDSVPGTLTSVQFSIDGGATWNPWVSPYTIGNLNSGTSKTVLLRGIVVSGATVGGTITNTATVSSSTLDPNPNNNTSTLITDINGLADISITKTGNPSPVIAGQTLTYTLLVSNLGPSDSQNVILSDTISTKLLNAEFSTNGGVSWTSWTTPYTIGTLVSGASRNILIRGIVSPDSLSSIDNTASITSTTQDPNPNNNTSTITTSINTSADIKVEKTANKNSIIAGEVLTYTIVVSNLGPSTSQNVNLSDIIPTSILTPEFSLNGGVSWNPWITPYNMGNLDPGLSKTILIRGTVKTNVTTPIINTATVNSITPDPNPNNNSSSVTTPITASADLQIAKVDSPDPVIAGQTLTYTILVSNAGLSDAQNVTLTDNISTNILNQQFSINNGVTWSAWVSPYNIGTLAANSSLTILIRGLVAPSLTGVVGNTATISSSTPDPNPNNNSSTTTTNITTLADLGIVKSGSANPVIAGQTLTYTIVVSNSGPSNALDVNISDSVPSQLLNAQFSINGGLTWNQWITPYNIPILNNGDSVTIQIRGKVCSGCTGIITNTSTVSSITPDNNLSNNTSTVETFITTLADLEVIKTPVINPVIAGQTVTYSIKISNLGPSDSQSVTLSDLIPVTILNPEFSEDSGASWIPWIGSHNIGTLTSGSSSTILIRGVVTSTATGTITNTATVSSPTQDPNPNNNSSTTVININTSADIGIVKTANSNPVIAGSVLVYTLVVSNFGPSTSQSVSLADTISPILSGVEFSINGGTTWNPWITPYNIGNLLANEVRTILIRGTVDIAASGSITNTATITSLTQDPNPNNNSSVVETQINVLVTSADISVVKTGSVNPVLAGETLTYSMLIKNEGPNAALNVTLSDDVPPLILNPEFSTNQITWSPWLNPYSIGTINVSNSLTISLRGRVSPDATGTLSNTAIVNSTTADPNLSNNTSTALTIVNDSADLEVIKTSNTSSAKAGETIIYTIVMTNLGPSTAMNVILTDIVEDKLESVEFSQNGGATWQPWISPYNVGNLEPSKTSTILIRGLVTSAAVGTTTNTATVSSSTFDPNLNNNTSTVQVSVNSLADIAVVKTTPSDIVIRGETITYTLLVSNFGPSDAPNINLTDAIPAEILNEEYSLNNGLTWTPWLGFYNFGMVEEDVSIKMLIRGQLSQSAIGQITNTANVLSPIPDPNLNNNTSSVTNNVNSAANLEVVKTSPLATVIAGETITYNVALSNLGPSDAQAVLLLDSIVPQILNPEFSTNGGVNWNSWINPYNVGTLQANKSLQIILRGVVDPSTILPIKNTAIINSPIPDPDSSNNISNIITSVDTLADLEIIKTSSPNPVVAGTTLTYNLKISNLGPSDAQNVVLSDPIPTNLENPEFSQDGGNTWKTWINSLNLGTLATNSSTNILIRGSVISLKTENVTNTATISSSTKDPNMNNNTSTNITQVTASADLEIIKSANKDTIIQGDNIIYTIIATNLGPSDSYDVTITDTLPVGITNQEYSLDNGVSWNTWLGSYNIPLFEELQPITILIRGIVGPQVGKSIVNTANIVSKTTPDPNINNNTSTVTTHIDTSADLQVTKTSNQSTVLAGQTITYTILVKNNGLSSAQNVVLTDGLPQQIQNAEYSLNGGVSWIKWVSPYTIGSLLANQSVTLLLRGTVIPDYTGILSNTIKVSSDTPDPKPDNNSSTALTTINASADISVSKVADPSPAIAGETLTYTLIVANAGPSTSKGVKLLDSISTELESIEFSTNNGATWNPWITPYNIGNLPPNTSLSILVRGKVLSSALGSISNTATVTSTTQDPNMNNNTQTITTQINTSADISVIKSADPSYLTPGDSIQYTILISNIGPSDSQGVTLDDSIPNSILNPQYSIDNGITWSDWNTPYNVGTIVVGNSKTLLIKGNTSTDTFGVITNTATVTAKTPDPNLNNNTSSVDINVNFANLNIVKSVNKEFSDVGEEITYTLTVNNTGNVIANNVFITDSIPNGTLYVKNSLTSSVPVTGTPETKIKITNGIDKASSITLSYKIIVTGIPNPNPIPNIAKVDYTYTINPNNPNSASGSKTSNTVYTEVRHGEILPQNAIKSVDKNPTTPGDVITYTITAKNTGNIPITNVIVKDTIPQGTSFVLGSVIVNNSPKPAENPNPGINVGTILAGDTAKVSFKVKIESSATSILSNYADINYSYTVTPNTPPINKNTPTNIVNTNVLKASIKLEKLADITGAVVGDIVRYSILVTNNGDVNLTNIVVKDTLSTELQYMNNLTINDVPSIQSILTGVSLASLAPNESAKISFDAKILAVPQDKIIRNVSTATYEYTVSGTTFKGDGKSNEADVKVYTPKLEVTKTSSENSVKINDTFVYSINVKNTGDIAVNDVIVKDNLPSAFLVKQITVDGIKVSGDLTIGINIGTIDPGKNKNVEITIEVIENLDETFKNISIVSGTVTTSQGNPPIKVTASGEDKVGVTVYNPELTLVKSADKTYAIVGDIVTYTIVATNSGDIVLNPVVIYDLLNPSLEFIDGSVYIDGILAPLSIILNGVDIGGLDIGQSKTITLNAKVLSNSINPIPNFAGATFEYKLPGQTPETENTTSNVVNVIPEVANIDIIKTADKDFVVLNDTITYTVLLKNTGTVDAFNVIFKDELPNEVQLVNGSFSVNGSVINGIDITKGVNIGTIKVGKDALIKYTVKVIKSNCNLQIQNAAYVKFQYRLPDGTGGTSQSKISSVNVALGISNFKQISIEENLIIPSQKPDVEDINDITADIEIIKSYIIKTPTLTSNEGQNLTGNKLVIHGVINEFIEYTALDEEQSVHSAHYSIPFSTFIVLPENYCNGSIEVSSVIEDIYFRRLNKRTVFSNATVLIKATGCNC